MSSAVQTNKSRDCESCFQLVEQEACQILEAQRIGGRRVSAETIIASGENLRFAQLELDEHRRGFFKKWWKHRLKLSKSTVYRYLGAYDVFGDCPNVGNFEPTALYLLSSRNTPKEALETCLDLAQQGRVITTRMAKVFIEWSKDDEVMNTTNTQPKTPPALGKTRPEERPACQQWEQKEREQSDSPSLSSELDC